MNWQLLDTGSIKILLILMSRSYKPMEFTVGYIVPINLETFVKVSTVSSYKYEEQVIDLRGLSK